MILLGIDIGGTNVKILATGQTESLKFPSGRTLTPKEMVARVKELTGDWMLKPEPTCSCRDGDLQ